MRKKRVQPRPVEAPANRCASGSRKPVKRSCEAGLVAAGGDVGGATHDRIRG